METDETDDFPPPFSLAALDGDRGRIVETAGAARAAERAAERGGRAAAKCYKCNGMGHWAQDCPQG